MVFLGAIETKEERHGGGGFDGWGKDATIPDIST